jgi:hypothetical protein
LNHQRESVLVFLDKRNRFWFDSLARIKTIHTHSKVVVVDIGNLDFPTPPPWLGLESALKRKNFAERFAPIGVSYIPPRRHISPDPLHSLTPRDRVRLQRAVRSSSNSFLRRSFVDEGRISIISRWLVEAHVRRKGRKALQLSRTLIKEYKPSKIYLVNGRLAHEKACLIAAEEAGLDVNYMEVNYFFGSLYLREYAPHDRLSLQREFELHKSNLNVRLASKLGTDYLANREQAGGQNPFSGLWRGQNKSMLGSSSLVLCATTSRDEYESLDYEWGSSEWQSQYQAFGEIVRAQDANLTPYLRIHPNLLNKSLRSIWKELQLIQNSVEKYPEFGVIWPASALNTYSLIKRAKLVVVQNSTVGLEALLMGKRVVCTSESIYDSLSGVTSVLNPRDLHLMSSTQEHDPKDAEKFLLAQRERDGDTLASAAGAFLEKRSSAGQFLGAIIDGSIWSVVWELRWKISRLIALRLLPKGVLPPETFKHRTPRSTLDFLVSAKRMNQN